MFVWPAARGVVVEAPAKLNLFFEVLGRRADGYHEIETLMIPIGLWDTLYLEMNPGGQVRLDCRQRIARSLNDPTEKGDASLWRVPEGADNLVVRAVQLLRERARVQDGAFLRLVKRIPAAAGLGGGSSDAAAALVAANAVWRLGWSRAELAEVAAELGSDVPFFLLGGSAVCRGRGERMEPVAGSQALHFVVVQPSFGVSTAAVYGVCQPGQPARSVETMKEAFVRGDAVQVGRLLFNRLETAATQVRGSLARLRRALQREDCLGCAMSGSGTSYFGLCRHMRHARRVARRLQATGVGTAFAVRGSLF